MLYVVIFYYLAPFIVFFMVNTASGQQNAKANNAPNVQSMQSFQFAQFQW
jgi:hypothetical protein